MTEAAVGFLLITDNQDLLYKYHILPTDSIQQNALSHKEKLFKTKPIKTSSL